MEEPIYIKKRNRYNYKTLQTFCYEYDVLVDNNLNENSKISSTTIISGKCKNNNCLENYSKSFITLYNSKVFMCHKCTQQEKIKKIKKTNLERYGVEQPLKSHVFKDKLKQTNKEKYGFEYSSQSQQVKDKKAEVFMKKYGVKTSLLDETIKKQIRNTNKEKYGFDNPFQSPQIMEKIKQTNMEKYGFENPSQSPDIAEKKLKTSFRKKEYTFPSGRKDLIQGFENLALDELLQKELIEENDIITGVKDVPEIWYHDEAGKKRRHFVDIFISSQNRCIEVKSTWTADKKQDNIYLKQKAGKELGYDYEIWIYNKNFEKIKTEK